MNKVLEFFNKIKHVHTNPTVSLEDRIEAAKHIGIGIAHIARGLNILFEIPIDVATFARLLPDVYPMQRDTILSGLQKLTEVESVAEQFNKELEAVSEVAIADGLISMMDFIGSWAPIAFLKAANTEKELDEEYTRRSESGPC